MKSNHKKTIDIIQSIFERYNNNFPDIFNKLYTYESKLYQKNPRHTFSKQDCLDVLHTYGKGIAGKDLDILPECAFLLYNWHKSKVIFSIDGISGNDDTDVRIKKKYFDLLPYPCIYFDIDFTFSKYIGCFISKTREKEDDSLQKYIICALVYYDEDSHYYILESLMIPLRDNSSISASLSDWFNRKGILISDIFNIIECIKLVLNILCNL